MDGMKISDIEKVYKICGIDSQKVKEPKNNEIHNPELRRDIFQNTKLINNSNSSDFSKNKF